MEKLAAMQIGNAGAGLAFTKRLAAEKDWSVAFADAVMAEYRRFLYLAATSPHPVTPSDEVDQAWHLHLTYSRHYWEVLCGEILGKRLHHGSTDGGRAENRRYRSQYQQTLDAYAAAFGHRAPLDIWPEPADRFGRRYRRVAMDAHWLVPKKAVVAVGASLALAACTPANLAIPAALLGLIAVGTLSVEYIRAQNYSSKKKKNDDGSGCGGWFGGGDSGDCTDGGGGDTGCGGGCGGCGG